MAKLKLDDILDCDLYSIEMENGKKLIHVDGYFYYASDNDDPPYRHVQACWCYVDIEELMRIADEDKQDMIDETFSYSNQYIDDLTEEQAQNILDHYFNGNPPERLSYNEITLDTPCGDYINY